jgi:hypothetical protein
MKFEEAGGSASDCRPGKGGTALRPAPQLFHGLVFALVGAWRQAAAASARATRSDSCGILGDLYLGQARFQQLVQ